MPETISIRVESGRLMRKLRWLNGHELPRVQRDALNHVARGAAEAEKSHASRFFRLTSRGRTLLTGGAFGRGAFNVAPASRKKLIAAMQPGRAGRQIIEDHNAMVSFTPTTGKSGTTKKRLTFGKQIAIPARRDMRGASGKVRKALLPQSLVPTKRERKASSSGGPDHGKRGYVVPPPPQEGRYIFMRARSRRGVNKGKRRRKARQNPVSMQSKLMYTLKPMAKLREPFRFVETARAYAAKNTVKAFRAAFKTLRA